MHRTTVEIYEERGTLWASRRKPIRRADAREFAGFVEPGELRADIGCGAGRYSADLGRPLVGIDAARSMLETCRSVDPQSILVQGDIERLPFADKSLRGAWANMSYVHVERESLPLALADLHRSVAVEAPVDIQVLAGDYEGAALEGDDVGGRFFCAWNPRELEDVVVGAGFEVDDVAVPAKGDVVRLRGRRARTLADTVGPDMRLLVVGLNPSLYAADFGVGYARPGNRFWPAAIEAGIVTRDRDPWHALRAHGVGMTDLVKRATPGAAEIAPDEYRVGMKRVERLARWLAPKAICMVGLSGWRAALGSSARVGVQERKVAGRPVYVMPSTSGANARIGLAELTKHLRAARDLAGDGVV